MRVKNVIQELKRFPDSAVVRAPGNRLYIGDDTLPDVSGSGMGVIHLSPSGDAEKTIMGGFEEAACSPGFRDDYQESRLALLQDVILTCERHWEVLSPQHAYLFAAIACNTDYLLNEEYLPMRLICNKSAMEFVDTFKEAFPPDHAVWCFAKMMIEDMLSPANQRVVNSSSYSYYKFAAIDLYRGCKRWLPVKRSDYEEQLGALPPHWVGNRMFMVGEAYTGDYHMTMRYDLNGGYYCCMLTLKQATDEEFVASIPYAITRESLQ